MTGKKRGIATRRKKEMILQKKDNGCHISKEVIFVFCVAAMIGSFLKGIVLGYLLGKHNK